TLQPHLFEAFVSVLFKKQRYKTDLTSKSNDKGADVVALKDNDNLLIQVKLWSNKLPPNVVGEIVKAKPYYEKVYKRPLTLCIATNNTLTQQAMESAVENNIRIVEGNVIKQLLQQYEVSLNDIHDEEQNRKSL
ncbi:Restriction endonuclease, type IV-like, Mrr domain protein, partial [Candidatus Magnetoovum chiemensis]